MSKFFLERKDRTTYSVSQIELERRWNAVRSNMQKEGVDCLVIQSQQRFVGGYFRWFTDIAEANYPITAIFPLDGEMTLISHGAPPPSPPSSPQTWRLRGVKEVINTPEFPNVWWEEAWDPGRAAEVIGRTQAHSVGLVGMGGMAASLSERLRELLPRVRFTNASNLVDLVRMVKSEEELELHKAAARMHQASIELAKQSMKEGRLLREIIADIRRAQMSMGSEEQQVFIQAGPFGSTGLEQTSWGNVFIQRTLKQGDVINILIESNASGGYWYDLRRFFVLGPSVPQELQNAYLVAREAREVLAAHCRPGESPAFALDASNEFLGGRGSPPEARIVGHGQGLDLVERPVIHKEEPAKFERNMVVSLHPTAVLGHASVSLADVFVTTDSGAVPIYDELSNDNEVTTVG